MVAAKITATFDTDDQALAFLREASDIANRLNGEVNDDEYGEPEDVL